MPHATGLIQPPVHKPVQADLCAMVIVAAPCEREQWGAAEVASQTKGRFPVTSPALLSSAHVAFLLPGRDEHKIFAKRRPGAEGLPEEHLRPTRELIWFVDPAGVKDEPRLLA